MHIKLFVCYLAHSEGSINHNCSISTILTHPCLWMEVRTVEKAARDRTELGRSEMLEVREGNFLLSSSPLEAEEQEPS